MNADGASGRVFLDSANNHGIAIEKMPLEDAKKLLLEKTKALKLKNLLTVKVAKSPTEYQVNVSLSLLALFFEQLDQIDIPAGEDDDDPLAENFRYIKAHFNSTVKLMKTITSGAALIEENEIDQSNIEAVLELIQTLPDPVEGATGNEDVHIIKDYVVSFLNYYYAFNQAEIPEKRDRSSSTVSKNLIESLSRKSKSKVSKQDQMAVNEGPKEDPIEQIGLPQDTKPASKHMRTKSHMKDPPETIVETDLEHKASARVRSTSRDNELAKRIDEIESDSESKHVPTPRGDAKTKLFASEAKDSQQETHPTVIVQEENEGSTVIHEDGGLAEIEVPQGKPIDMDSIEASPIPSDKKKPTGMVASDFDLEKSMEKASPEEKTQTKKGGSVKSNSGSQGGSRKSSQEKPTAPENKKDGSSKSKEPAKKTTLGKSIDTIQEESASKQEESVIADEKPKSETKSQPKAAVSSAIREKSLSKDKNERGQAKSKEPAKQKETSSKVATPGKTAPSDAKEQEPKVSGVKPKSKETPKPSETSQEKPKATEKPGDKSREPAKTGDKSKEPAKVTEKSKEPAKTADKSKSKEPAKVTEKSKEPAKTVEKSKSKEPAKVAEKNKEPVKVTDKTKEPAKTVDKSKSKEPAKVTDKSKSKEPAKATEKNKEPSKTADKSKSKEPAKTSEKTKEPTKKIDSQTTKGKELPKTPQKAEKSKEPAKPIQKDTEKKTEVAKPADAKSKSKENTSKIADSTSNTTAATKKPVDNKGKQQPVSKPTEKDAVKTEVKATDKKAQDAKSKSASKEKDISAKKSTQKDGSSVASTKHDSKATSVQAKTAAKTESKDKSQDKQASAKKTDSLNTSKASAKSTGKNASNVSDSTAKAKGSSVGKSNLKNKSEAIVEMPEEENEASPAKKSGKQTAQSKVSKSNVSQSQSNMRNSSAAKSKNESSVDKSKVSSNSKAKQTSKDKPSQNKTVNLSKISSVQSENDTSVATGPNKGKKANQKAEEPKGNWKKSEKAVLVKGEDKSKTPAKQGKDTSKPPVQSRDKSASNLKASQQSGRGRQSTDKLKKSSKPPVVEPSEESEESEPTPEPVSELTSEQQAKMKKIPNLDLALGSLKSSASYAKYKGTIKSTRSSKNSTNFISRNVSEFGDRRWETKSNRVLNYKPNFPDTDFVYVREHKEQQLKKQATMKKEEEAKKAKTEADESKEPAEGEEEQTSERDESKKSRPESARLAPKKDVKLDDMFKRFANKTEKLYARAQSARPLKRAKYGQTKYERMMAKGPNKKFQGGPSIVSRFQQDSELLMNHVKRKEEAINPALREIEKERELITQMKLRQSTLMFELNRSHLNKIREDQKMEEERECEFKREQRIKGKEFDLEKAKEERMLERKRKQEQLAEEKRIKAEIKQIMEKNFETEKNFYVDIIKNQDKANGSPILIEQQTKSKKDKPKKSNPLEFRAMIEEAAQGTNFTMMRTYHQARESELKSEKNNHKHMIAGLVNEIQYLEVLLKKQKEDEGVPAKKASKKVLPPQPATETESQ